LELTLPKKYLSMELQQQQQQQEVAASASASGLQYELVAAVLHLGGRATGGHYTCFGRHGDGDGDGDGKWYYFDDQKVSEATSRDVLNARSEVCFF
jgi:uncharacterized UBP type Zn finger protein